MKKLLFLIIAAGLVYLNYTTPSREEHEALLYAELQALGPVTDEQYFQAMKNVDFSNFMVCSATKTTLDSKMISLGYLKEVKMINNQWAGEIMKKFVKPQ